MHEPNCVICRAFDNLMVTFSQSKERFIKEKEIHLSMKYDTPYSELGY